MFNIIITNKNNTAIAPTYTITKVKPRNSAQNKNNNMAAFKKVKIKNMIDSIEFKDKQTANPQRINKKQINKCNIFIK
jgi:hypothetical protein